MRKYKFNPEFCFNRIKEHWTEFAKNTGASSWIIGNSGGKDSNVCIHLAAKIFGPEHVYALAMPNGVQRDFKDALEVVEHSKVHSCTFNIKEMYDAMIRGYTDDTGFAIDEDARINLGPRLRMTALYFYGRSFNSFVVNTDNLDERITGYFTLYGDGAGDYAPLKDLTVTEVIELGKWLGIPDHLINKKPGDGLQEKGDEDRLGFKYSDLDLFIRQNIGDEEFKDKICKLYNKNLYKTEVVKVPGPAMPYPNYVDLETYVQNILEFTEKENKEEK